MKCAVIAMIGALALVGCESKADGTREAADAPADNTKVNERDREGETLKPEDQGGSEADRNVTADVRKGVVGADDLSMNAKNVKIITNEGVVTLRGPVASTAERDRVGAIAQNTAGVKRVDNQLEVAN